MTNEHWQSPIEFCVQHVTVLHGTLAEDETPLSLYCRLCEVERELWLDVPLGIGVYTAAYAVFLPLDERRRKTRLTQLLQDGNGQLPTLHKLDFYCRGNTVHGNIFLTSKYYFVREKSCVKVFPRRKRTAVYVGQSLSAAKEWAIRYEQNQHEQEERTKNHESEHRSP